MKKQPHATWGAETGLIREVDYDGEPFQGRPTRVFAYYAKPKGEGHFLAMLLAHGGGGAAFRKWAQHWAERGYAALAMDLAGHRPDGKRRDDGGPEQGTFRLAAGKISSSRRRLAASRRSWRCFGRRPPWLRVN
ncbi:hypothetical protein [Singulisphaera sp. GP187]|uniref:hypothetical protein n=1 Tax=Singulisphaera sp. GP187 TaxID=1882752 RepID=UPI0020B145E8|nr:hypothetical protein [Singulisphaera sp. GP187]